MHVGEFQGAAAADRAAQGHGRPHLAVYSAHGLADLLQGHLQPQQVWRYGLLLPSRLIDLTEGKEELLLP